MRYESTTNVTLLLTNNYLENVKITLTVCKIVNIFSITFLIFFPLYFNAILKSCQLELIFKRS